MSDRLLLELATATGDANECLSAMQRLLLRTRQHIRSLGQGAPPREWTLKFLKEDGGGKCWECLAAVTRKRGAFPIQIRLATAHELKPIWFRNHFAVTAHEAALDVAGHVCGTF